MKNKVFALLMVMCMAAGCGIKEESIEAMNEIESVTEIESYSSEPETIEETTIVLEEEPSFQIVMVGDVLLHDRVQQSGKLEEEYSYGHIFQNVQEYIMEADLALVNQEVILGGAELGLSGYPAFNGAYEVGDAIVEAGFDVVLHATNHALDKGKKGVLNCISFWEKNYPKVGIVGIHNTEEDDEEIYLYELGEYTVAILNYTYGTNGIEPPSDMSYAVEYWSEEKIREDVEKAHQLADFVIVCPHWGTEYVLKETESQKKQAKFLADLEVDLVLGTHPHVIEPIEWVEGINGNKTLVYYSLGNYINATSGTGEGTSNRMLGAMANVTLGIENDELVVVEYGALPLVAHVGEGFQGCTTYFLKDYTEELALQNEIVKQDSAFSKEYCENLWNMVME